MPEPQHFSMGFPLGGVVKASSYAAQPENTTAAALNVWPYDYPGGRTRGGVRPALVTSTTSPPGTPYNWCNYSWKSGYGVAVTTSSGTYTSTNGTSWTQRISTNPNPNKIASCASLNNELFQATDNGTGPSGIAVRAYDFIGGGTTDLTAEPYPGGHPMVGLSKGTVPDKCGLVFSWNGSLYLAADYDDPHLIYRSRANNPRDWDFSARDEGAAWASSGIGGHVSRPIIAALDHGNNCLFIGHNDAISVLRGDPQMGAPFELITDFLGPVMQSAWCKIGSGETCMMTRHELCFIAAGCGGPPSSVSRFKLPDELCDLQADSTVGYNDWASVAYDARYNGIFIFIDRYGADAHEYSQFFFDLGGQGFWPMEFTGHTDFRLGVTLPALSNYTTGQVMAIKNGKWGYFNSAATETKTSHVLLGPIQIGSGMIDGILTRLSAMLTEDSEAVDFAIYCGDSAAEAYKNYDDGNYQFDGTWDRQGRNVWCQPRLRGNCCYIDLSYTGTGNWGFEQIYGESFPVSLGRVNHNDP